MRNEELGMGGAPHGGGDRYVSPAIEGWAVAEPRANPVREKSFSFALEVIELCRDLHGEREYVLSKQFMRSGTAVGALVEEAIGAESRRDFLHKMSIAHKEAREVLYWLRLIDASAFLSGTDLSGTINRANELVSLLTSITGTVKESIEK